VESRQFARLVCGPVSRNLIRTQFINKRAADSLAARPPAIAKRAFRHLAVVGVGMMGRGIGFMAASAGLRVSFLDATLDAARGGPAFARKLLERQVAAGRRRPEEIDEVLGRMSVTDDHRELAACDIVVEAVFEDREIKRDVWTRLDAVMAPDALLASNTSSLPISGLASFVRDPARFIGLHFFSPVERMPLVEVIRGGLTSDITLAHALDFVGQLRKTPIVVNDSRGFFTSRVFLSYCHEGQAMLAEGVAPALIENAARLGGMSVGPLAVTDEVSSELQWHLIRQAEEDLGSAFVPPVSYEVLRRFATEIGRPGRKAGRGFYDYPADGLKRLWPGLSELYRPAAVQPDVAEVRDRLLFIQSLEAARCLDEGVLTSAAEADLGSVLGIGFPAWTGGVVSFVETCGAKDFLARARRLSRLHGGRFEPSPWLEAHARRLSAASIKTGRVS
jgi:3-hydroxyacyl-CoA dehydrogenase/enoyl-CoA hydratase/3-hydroxybutyryl-CoA epimerase